MRSSDLKDQLLVKDTIICDIDGTIANISHRLHFIKDRSGIMKKTPDWNSFNHACKNDKPISDVIQVVKLLWSSRDSQTTPNFNLKFFTGRNTLVRENTLWWLTKHFFKRESSSQGQIDLLEELGVTLSMRDEDDFRDDCDVKLEMMQEFKLIPENVLCIFEDRQTVVDMWRNNGYRVMQVNSCNDR